MINGETANHYPMVLLKVKRRMNILKGSDPDIDCNNLFIWERKPCATAGP